MDELQKNFDQLSVKYEKKNEEITGWQFRIKSAENLARNRMNKLKKDMEEMSVKY